MHRHCCRETVRDTKSHLPNSSHSSDVLSLQQELHTAFPAIHCCQPSACPGRLPRSHQGNNTHTHTCVQNTFPFNQPQWPSSNMQYRSNVDTHYKLEATGNGLWSSAGTTLGTLCRFSEHSTTIAAPPKGFLPYGKHEIPNSCVPSPRKGNCVLKDRA